ncbi:hypothetical protein V6N13_121170 [Hibiscus sabdariffa]
MNDLRMGANRLSGNLESELGFAFRELKILYLGDNQFSGRIPVSVTNISSLKQFDIHSNGFSGLVPENMGNLWNLDLFAIDYNELGNGKGGDLRFLSSLSNCTRLKLLAIHMNRLSGVLPDSVANLSAELETLYMGGNQISGNIPDGNGDLVKLTQIHIGENLFTGNVPTSIRKLRNVGRFDLSLNRFSGEIPSCWQSIFVVPTLFECFDVSNSRNLLELYVDNNDFSGEIPERFGEISELRILHMQGNHFHVSSVFIATVCWKKQSGKETAASASQPVGFMRVSYKELVEATNGFAASNLIEQVEEILDNRLIEQINEKSHKRRGEENIGCNMLECLVSFANVGIACSVEVPVERMKIEDAVTELHAIKARLHAKNQIHPHKGIKELKV